ncbi:MAG: arsenite methyltransferase [Dehalococcoidia bacterium]|nr:arsenite methyltransferase [Dehalococcoidia bacterium]
MKDKEIKEVVKGRYGQIAKQDQQSCCPSCSGGASSILQSEGIGYKREDLERVPEEAIMGLGCGNPTAIADLKVGEVVLDLGSGAGVDVFLAANKVGPTGKAIGVDMTKEMIDKAKRIAANHGYQNVEFRLGEMENLPVEDEYVDAIISNCVVNLSPDKLATYKEVFRVLKPDGRVLISDIVTEGELPEDIRQSFDSWTECIAGAVETQEYLDTITKAGFRDVTIVAKHPFCEPGMDDRLTGKLISIQVQAYK